MVWRVTRIVLLLVLVLTLPLAESHAQGPTELAQAQSLIDRMSADDKVGQLFLVTYPGTDTGPTSDIARLIRDYRIGGVVISPANGNLADGASSDPRRVAELTNTLQTQALTVSRDAAVPLFIAVEQEGDDYPHTTLRTDFTPLPSFMALGATWREANSLATGRIVGQELAAVGVNMLLGPSLDVLSVSGRVQSGDLGLRSLGGDPQWVARHGRLYIQGVHQGSVGRVITVARHFPGIGASDRSPDEELATVERAVVELKRVDMTPFLSVTANSPNRGADLTDAMMSAHVRYRALQGATNRPIGLDPQGLQGVLNLPELSAWRERGLMISDALGAPAVRKSYDPSLQSFNQKNITRDALMAGNDILYVGRFALTDSWSDQMGNVRQAIEFFRETYRTDARFRERVDRSLTRILLAKRRLYPSFTSDAVFVDARAAEGRAGRDEATIAGIAREAVTLISPTREELASRLPRPVAGDRLLIITDARMVKECPACPQTPLLPPNALADTILRLYGPAGAGILAPDQVRSLNYADLKGYLTPGSALTDERRREIDALLQTANLIVFAMLDLNTAVEPNADALRLFLRDRRDLFRDKRIVAISYGAPYFLDATEINKLSAYFAVYSKTAPFIEASVRALLGEFVPQGAPPVSIPGVYDLVSMLEPDPTRPIPLAAPGKGPGEKVTVGETVNIRAGPILDRNGRPAPDRVTVNFTFFYRAEAVYLRSQSVVTRDGIAEVSVYMERPGQLEITAATGQAATTAAGQAVTAAPLILAVQGEGPVTATPTTAPTVTFTPPPTPMPTQTPAPTPTPPPAPPAESGRWTSLALSLAMMLIVGGAGTQLNHHARGSPTNALRLLLLGLAWGLAGYLLFLAWVSLSVATPPLWSAPLISGLFVLTSLGWVAWRGR